MKNKRGWIRIVEAVVALLIITGALLIAITGGYLKKDISEQVYDSEMAILKEISKDQSMRNAIIGASSPPVSWKDFDASVKAKIESRIPSYLECKGRICALDKTCELLEVSENKDVYAKSIAITTAVATYKPRQLKLFCWEKT